MRPTYTWQKIAAFILAGVIVAVFAQLSTRQVTRDVSDVADDIGDVADDVDDLSAENADLRLALGLLLAEVEASECAGIVEQLDVLEDLQRRDLSGEDELLEQSQPIATDTTEPAP